MNIAETFLAAPCSKAIRDSRGALQMSRGLHKILSKDVRFNRHVFFSFFLFIKGKGVKPSVILPMARRVLCFKCHTSFYWHKVLKRMHKSSKCQSMLYGFQWKQFVCQQIRCIWLNLKIYEDESRSHPSNTVGICSGVKLMMRLRGKKVVSLHLNISYPSTRMLLVIKLSSHFLHKFLCLSLESRGWKWMLVLLVTQISCTSRRIREGTAMCLTSKWKASFLIVSGTLNPEA